MVWIARALLIALLAVPTLPAGPALGAEALPALERVAPDVYVFTGPDGEANAGVVVGDEGVVVIDSSPTPETARRLAAEIKRLTPKPILYVVFTHFHGDHIFGNQY